MNKQKGNISVIVSFIIVLVIIGLVVYALNKGDKITPSEQVNSNPVTKESAPVVNNTQPVKEQPVTKNNTMDKVSKNGDILVMNYTGKLQDGTVFDSNVLPKFGHVQPFEFKLGAGMVIKGWDEGLVGMKVGEKKTLTIPPEKGYGSRGVGSIPPNSTLIFDVELVGIK